MQHAKQHTLYMQVILVVVPFQMEISWDIVGGFSFSCLCLFLTGIEILWFEMNEGKGVAISKKQSPPPPPPIFFFTNSVKMPLII